MSNDARLLISNRGGEPMTDADWDAETPKQYVNLPLLESADTIPVLWLTLFTAEDVKTYREEDDEEEIPYLVAPTAQGKAQFQRRLPELRKAFRNIDAFLPNWQEALDKMDRRFIKVDLSEVLDMLDEGDLLEPALRAFEDPRPETMLALMRLSEFPTVFDTASQTFIDHEERDGRTTVDYLMGSDPWG